MKKINIAAFVLSVITTAALVSSCDNKRDPGRVYMPDMAYSRAYEAYAMHNTTLFTTEADKRGGNIIFYNSMPVPGTMRRGELYPYTLPNNSDGYKMSAAVKNPMDSVRFSMSETARLYNINCGICHGDKAAGNGPMATSGNIGGVANLTLPLYVSMADGTMFHSITYGKGLMGTYASQLSRQQRWQIIKYIRTLQAPAAGAGTDSASVKKSADSAMLKKG